MTDVPDPTDPRCRLRLRCLEFAVEVRSDDRFVIPIAESFERFVLYGVGGEVPADGRSGVKA